MPQERFTLLEAAKASDPDGKVAQVVEILDEMNPILQDAPSYAGNAPLGNRVTLRSSLPAVQFTKFNKGTPRSKSTYEQRVDTMGIIDGASEIDVKFKIGLTPARVDEHRRLQDRGFIESISQTVATTIVYGDERSNEAAFTGLAPRMATLGTPMTGAKVITAGGAGADNASAYVVDWSENYVHLIRPESGEGGGNQLGIVTRDLGEQRVTDADGNPFQALVTTYMVAMGLTVKDPRHLGRLANIDVSDIANAGLGGYAGPDLIIKLTDLLTEMPDPNGARRVIYVPNRIWGALHKIALAKSNAALTLQDYTGRGLLPFFWNYPIRRLDRLSLAEALVS